jgi:DNA-binding LacI/PurR family transcriptional regulator
MVGDSGSGPEQGGVVTQAAVTRPAASARPRATTSADVARRAAVSRSTVSHVLNGQTARFNPDTVERVRQAAADLGYVPSAAGRALVIGRSDFIVIVAPDTTLTRLQDVVEVLAADMKDLGFTAVAHFPPTEAERELPSRLHRVVEALRPAGVIDLGGLSARDLDYLRGIGCPVLTQFEQDTLNPYIGTLQAAHLHSRGHTEIAYAFLSDGRTNPYASARATGVGEFCAEHNLRAPAHVSVSLDPSSAAQALDQLVGRYGRRFGIACYNDEVALALVYAAQRLGLSIPDEVGVIGVDRSSAGQLVVPRLSTVSADVVASLARVRLAIVRTYGTGSALEELPPLDEVVSVLPGETS